MGGDDCENKNIDDVDEARCVQTEPKKKLSPQEAAEQAELLRARIKAKNQVNALPMASYSLHGLQ